MEVNKAVIPAAGFGTRFLPVTKAQPKEMMPVLDKPTIQYVVEEAVESGIDDILIITGRGKESIVRHFDKSYELEEELENAGKTNRLNEVRSISNIADIHYVRQRERDGLGDAVMYAKKHVGDSPFALLLGDTIVESEVPCTKKLIDIGEKHDKPVVSLERVPEEDVSSYGIADVDSPSMKGEFKVADFVEKPHRSNAPSNLAITGRYVLTPQIFTLLEATEPGVGNELQLTDALRKLPDVMGAELTGDRFDIGNIPSWLEANAQMALRHADGKINTAIERIIQESVDD